MKSLLIAILSALVMGVSFPSEVNAQAGGACFAPIVDASCVGACGATAEMEYSSPIVISPSKVKEQFCVTTQSSSLCPTDNSFTSIYVNGKILDVYNSTAAGTTYSFAAARGSKIKVITELRDAKTNINCVWLGEVHLALRKL